MKTIEVKGQKRVALGRKYAIKERKSEFVPCVMYGAGQQNLHFTAKENEFRHLVYTPKVYTIKLQVDEQHYDAILQEVQFHPVNDKIIHVDFKQVFEDKKVIIDVPVKLHGFPVGVKEGGKLSQLKRKLKVRAFIKDLPEAFDIDVEHLKIGHTVKVSDMKLDMVDFLDMKNAVIASVKITRNIVEEVAPGAEGAATATTATAVAGTATGTATGTTTATPATGTVTPAQTDKTQKPDDKDKGKGKGKDKGKKGKK
ncbi:MAG: 50S ribosomal protein L25/general stress protein Ctc [Bacteroidia bacterium]|nr:50S ribosomal protein L25/general stress protein Ctc [Bacteroidia bacterium]